MVVTMQMKVGIFVVKRACLFQSNLMIVGKVIEWAVPVALVDASIFQSIEAGFAAVWVRGLTFA